MLSVLARILTVLCPRTKSKPSMSATKASSPQSRWDQESRQGVISGASRDRHATYIPATFIAGASP